MNIIKYIYRCIKLRLTRTTEPPYHYIVGLKCNYIYSKTEQGCRLGVYDVTRQKIRDNKMTVVINPIQKDGVGNYYTSVNFRDL